MLALIVLIGVAVVVVPSVVPSVVPAVMPPAGAVAGAVHVAATPAAIASADPATAGAEHGAFAGRGIIDGSLPAPPDVAAALPRGAPPLASLTGYRWPLPHGRLTLSFGPSPWGSRIVDGRPFHDGIDLATSYGDRIVAAHDGVVLAPGRHYDDAIGWVGDLSAYYRRLDAKQLWSTLPIVVITDDGNGYRSIYAHFSKIVVRVGDMVHAGALIGYEGQTGRASGCHLHYGLFSIYERGVFGIEPSVVERMKVPTAEVARVDPLLALPQRPAKPPKAEPSPSP